MAKIWVVLQLRDGQVPRLSWEALAAGQKLASTLGGKAEAILLGSGIAAAGAEVATRDLGAVYVVDHEALRGYTPGSYVGALAPVDDELAGGLDGAHVGEGVPEGTHGLAHGNSPARPNR